MSDRLYLYPLIIRIWHVLNAICIVGLIITGASMQAIGSQLDFIDFKLAVKIHDIFGIILSVNYLLFIFANIKTKNTRHYFYKSEFFVKKMGQQLRYYLFGIFKNEHHPFPPTEQKKFNPLQQFSYVLVMYFFVPLMIITGLAFLFPNFIFDQIMGMPGIFLNDIIHVLTGFICTMFLFIHLYFCTIGDTFTSNFKSMITGWHKVHH